VDTIDSSEEVLDFYLHLHLHHLAGTWKKISFSSSWWCARRIWLFTNCKFFVNYCINFHGLLLFI